MPAVCAECRLEVHPPRRRRTNVTPPRPGRHSTVTGSSSPLHTLLCALWQPPPWRTRSSSSDQATLPRSISVFQVLTP